MKMSDSADPNLIYVARQPIVDWKKTLMGHEILFRSDKTNAASIKNQYTASANVITAVMTGFGITDVLGPHKGFFNVSYDFLLSDKLELLPPRQTVIELLEDTPYNETVLQRCRDLRAVGYMIALDDHIFDPETSGFYEVADIVKIDVLQTPHDKLVKSALMFNKMEIITLAEKVETHEQFYACRELGFNLFQGYFFARPEVMAKEAVNVSKLSVLNLLKLVMADARIDDIENAFMKDPVMLYKLLRLVNSVMIGCRYKIQSVRHAISILGMNQLKRWVLLSVFGDKNASSLNSPLFELAAHRGKLMEIIAGHIPDAAPGSDMVSAAFITGVLSLLDLALNVRLVDLCEELNIDRSITLALMHKDGMLGMLLNVVEAVETENLPLVEECLNSLGVREGELLAAQFEAIKWVNCLE